jgi:hypothetical protein
MLSREQIAQNKEEFISLISSINREGAKIDKLLEKLEGSDFFYAPASTQFHGAYEGGLCDHCLNVYYNMMHLVNYKAPTLGIDPETLKESILVVSLLHDISKMNLYTLSAKNTKVYCAEGDKSDILGNFYWDTKLIYSIRDISERFVYGSHEETSEYMIRQFIPLTLEESNAILHHMGGMSWDSAQDKLGESYNRYPLGVFLYTADMLSSYIDERDVK